MRDEVAMDVDEDEDATQRPKQVQDYGIEVDFDELDEDVRENGSVVDFDKEIAKLNSDIERMAPNLKAIERWGFYFILYLASVWMLNIIILLGWMM